MARLKFDYGIDLGTTNSAIARMENGGSVIKQTRNLMDTLPSCVYFSKNKKGEKSIRVGIKAKDSKYSDAITAMSKGEVAKEFGYIEFKREMGSDKKYSNENMSQPYYTPEQLSAEVLKELKSLINDEEVNYVVITIPAIFSAQAIDATKKAAEKAGFKKNVLLQEPIAACMAYNGTATNKDGIWMVFDFGGGTFDAALVKSEDGLLQVFDTAGNPYLGGKNLDEEVIKQILIPHLQDEYNIDSFLNIEWKKKVMFDALKGPAEEIRIALSFEESTDYSTYDRNMNFGVDDDGEEISLDITVTRQQLKNAITGEYQKAIDICKDLLKRNNLDGKKVNIILVGGPTYSPIIREMLSQQISENVDTSVNPMTAVARGAALHAATIDVPTDLEEETTPTSANEYKLKLGFDAASVNSSEWVSVQLDDNKTSSLTIEIERSDGAWRSDKVNVDKVGNVVEVFLLQDKPSTFTVRAYDHNGNTVKVTPQEFTIIPGGVMRPPLAQHVGIEIWSDTKQGGVLELLKGLSKNTPLPATGVTKRTLKTTSDLRPGVEDDKLVIRLYQSEEYEAEGRIARLNNYMGEMVVTGDDVDTVVPKDSDVDVTVKVNEESLYTITVDIPTYTINVTKPMTVKKLSHEDSKDEISSLISLAEQKLRTISSGGHDVSNLRSNLDSVKDSFDTGNDIMRTVYDIKSLLRKIEDVEEGTEWERLEKELREEFERLEKAQNELGNDKTAQLVNQLRTQTDSVIRSKDVKLGHGVLDQISNLFIHLTMLYQCMALIRHYNDCFGSVRWKDTGRARQLINQGLTEMNNQPTTERIHPIACGIIELLPPDEANNAGGMLR